MSLESILQYRKENTAGWAASYQSMHRLILAMNGGIVYLVLRYTEIILADPNKADNEYLLSFKLGAFFSLILLCLVLSQLQLSINSQKQAILATWDEEKIFDARDYLESTNSKNVSNPKYTQWDIAKAEKEMKLELEKRDRINKVLKIFHFGILLGTVLNSIFISIIVILTF